MPLPPWLTPPGNPTGVRNPATQSALCWIGVAPWLLEGIGDVQGQAGEQGEGGAGPGVAIPSVSHSTNSRKPAVGGSGFLEVEQLSLSRHEGRLV